MKQIFNFLITGVILYLASVYFPDVVQISSISSLIVATILLFVAEILVVLIIFIMMAFSVFSGNIAGLVAGIIMVCFAEIVALSLVSLWVPGVTIVGFWTKFMLAFVLSIFRIPDKQNNDN